MTLAYKLGPLELCFTVDHSPDEAHKRFASKFGYQAESSRVALGLLRLGPVYQTFTASSSTIMPGDSVLIAGQWQSIADVDGNTVLTSSGELLTLLADVTLRSR